MRSLALDTVAPVVSLQSPQHLSAEEIMRGFILLQTMCGRAPAVLGASPRRSRSTTRLGAPRSIRAACALGAALLAACGGDVVESQSPDLRWRPKTGEVRVAVVTSGSDLDPDGYAVRLDGGSPLRIAVNATITIPGLATGSHAVALGDIAANCTAAGSNPQTVTVTRDATTDVSWSVSCVAVARPPDAPVGTSVRPVSSSAIEVTWTDASTSEDGFRIERSSTATGPWEPAGTTGAGTVAFIDQGRTSEQQTCYRVVALAAQTGESVPSNTDCTSPPVAPANLTANAVDSQTIALAWIDGSAVEDGYEVERAFFESGPFAAVADLVANAASHLETGLSPGTTYWYRVRAKRDGGFGDLSGTVTAATPVTPPGAIRVTTATTGFDLDANGYYVRVDDRCCDTNMGDNSVATISPVAPGQHSIWLGHVATNCSVDGANPRAVSVASGATTDVTFAVTCGWGPAIEVTTVTTGLDLDADGYCVYPWRLLWMSRVLETSGSVTANGTVRLFGLITGDYEVELTGIATNCSPTNGSHRYVDLTYGGTAAIEFDLACAPIPPGTEACDNGLDDDGDGLVDAMDPDCQLFCPNGDCFADTCGAGFVCNEIGCCVSHCGDGARNGDESDIDCGGSCDPCQTGQHCSASWECSSGLCVNGVCQ